MAVSVWCAVIAGICGVYAGWYLGQRVLIRQAVSLNLARWELDPETGRPRLCWACRPRPHPDRDGHGEDREAPDPSADSLRPLEALGPDQRHTLQLSLAQAVAIGQLRVGVRPAAFVVVVSSESGGCHLCTTNISDPDLAADRLEEAVVMLRDVGEDGDGLRLDPSRN